MNVIRSYAIGVVFILTSITTVFSQSVAVWYT